MPTIEELSSLWTGIKNEFCIYADPVFGDGLSCVWSCDHCGKQAHNLFYDFREGGANWYWCDYALSVFAVRCGKDKHEANDEIKVES